MFNVNNYDLNTKNRSIEETSSEIDSDSFIVSDNRTISVVSSTEGINNYFFGIRDTERTINGQAQKNPKKKKKNYEKLLNHMIQMPQKYQMYQQIKVTHLNLVQYHQ